MQVRTYTERSNARRAARAAGLDPDTIIQTEDGFEVRFPAPKLEEDEVPVPQLTESQRVIDTADSVGGKIVNLGQEVSEVKRDDGSVRYISNDHLRPAGDGLDIPDFCRLSPAQRKASWEKNPPKAAAIRQNTEDTAMAKAKSSKGGNRKDRPSGSDKNATLLSMLKKGATVESLCKATDWLPHTLRARISRLNKPKSKGGEGLKIERERVDGVTSYRIAG